MPRVKRRSAQGVAMDRLIAWGTTGSRRVLAVIASAALVGFAVAPAAAHIFSGPSVPAGAVQADDQSETREPTETPEPTESPEASETTEPAEAPKAAETEQPDSSESEQPEVSKSETESEAKTESDSGDKSSEAEHATSSQS